jgi:nitrite reductase (NADH) small subunit
MQWIPVAPVKHIPPRKGLAILIGHLSLAVFNTGERFLAVENRCPHSGDPLADGIVTGTTVTCPRHYWSICLETGPVTKPSVEGTQQVRTFPAEVRDGTVMLDLDAQQAMA